MDIVQFPNFKPEWSRESKTPYHKNYNVHFKYFLNLLYSEDVKVNLTDAGKLLIRSVNKFDIEFNGKKIVIDFSDHAYRVLDDVTSSKFSAIFKMHYNESEHGHIKNMYSLSPVSFNNWNDYFNLAQTIEYKAIGPILNNQKIYGAAVKRRTHVRNILKEKYNPDFSITDSLTYYDKINHSLVSVHVPGANNNMLDRAQQQLMALGSCTISPFLKSTLSWNAKLIPGIHYIQCRDDYSDLISKIEWCKNNTTACIKIGQNAKKLFAQTSTPEQQVKWITQCLNKK